MKKLKLLIKNLKYLMRNDLSNPKIKIDLRGDKLIGVIDRKSSRNS